MKGVAVFFLGLSLLCTACAHTHEKPKTDTVYPEAVATEAVDVAPIKVEAKSPEVPTQPLATVAPEIGCAAAPDSISMVLAKIVGFLVLLSLGAVVLVRFLKSASLQGLGLGKVKASALQIKETRLLGNKQFLLVVEYEGQKMLLGTSPNGLQYLCKLDSPEGKRSEIIKDPA